MGMFMFGWVCGGLVVWGFYELTDDNEKEG